MTPRDLERMQAAGMYDPAAADAEHQRVVLEGMEARGLTADDILSAHRLGALVLVAFEHLIRPGPLHTPEAVAAKTGVTQADLRQLRRAWGFPDPAPGEACWTEADIRTLELFRMIGTLASRDVALHIARTSGTAMSRIADAEIALIRSQLEAPMLDQGAPLASMLSAYENVIGAFLPAAARMLDALHRHFLLALGRRYVGWGLRPTSHNLLDLIIGFADLSGSTALVQQLDYVGLDRALSRVEERTSDVIAAGGVSLVKRLGDGVMFVSPEPARAARVALDLVDALSDAALGPPVRVGLAAGRVVALRGDFFGPAVHLAARLVHVAPPAAVLVSDTVRDQLADLTGLRCVPGGTHQLAGFEVPVTAHRLERTE